MQVVSTVVVETVSPKVVESAVAVVTAVVVVVPVVVAVVVVVPVVLVVLRDVDCR